MPTIPPMPDEFKNFRTGPPSGYAPLKGAPPAEAVKVAKALLSKPMGTQEKRTIEEEDYLFQVEPQYKERGSPSGWHKGVAVYVKK